VHTFIRLRPKLPQGFRAINRLALTAQHHLVEPCPGRLRRPPWTEFAVEAWPRRPSRAPGGQAERAEKLAQNFLLCQRWLVVTVDSALVSDFFQRFFFFCLFFLRRHEHWTGSMNSSHQTAGVEAVRGTTTWSTWPSAFSRIFASHVKDSSGWRGPVSRLSTARRFHSGSGTSQATARDLSSGLPSIAAAPADRTASPHFFHHYPGETCGRFYVPSAETPCAAPSAGVPRLREASRDRWKSVRSIARTRVGEIAEVAALSASRSEPIRAAHYQTHRRLRHLAMDAARIVREGSSSAKTRRHGPWRHAGSMVYERDVPQFFTACKQVQVWRSRPPRITSTGKTCGIAMRNGWRSSRWLFHPHRASTACTLARGKSHPAQTFVASTSDQVTVFRVAAKNRGRCDEFLAAPLDRHQPAAAAGR